MFKLNRAIFICVIFIATLLSSYNIKAASKTSHTYTIKYDIATSRAILEDYADVTIKTNGKVTWKVKNTNINIPNNKNIKSYKIKFYSDQGKSQEVACGSIFDNCTNGSVISRGLNASGKIKCKKSPCNNNTDPESSESYWFKVFDIKLEDKQRNESVSRDIDPRILIKNG